METFNTDIFDQFNRTWGLLCAGTEEDHNAMTISWGALGTLWGRPAATVYVRPSRLTSDYMEYNDYFTIGFFDDSYKRVLGEIYGTLSGRDTDKDGTSGLTPVASEYGVYYKEATVTLVCRKMFSQPMDKDEMADFAKDFYKDAAPHKMYIGEVIDIIR